MKLGSGAFLLLALLLTGFISLAMQTGASRGQYSRDYLVKKDLLQFLRLDSLAIASECTAARCLTEGIFGCLGDMPGGYCYHSDCDLVGPPDIPTLRDIEILIEKAK